MTSLSEGLRVIKAPPTVHYIPNFITPEEGSVLWDHVYGAPKPKWTQLSNRRLQNWGGVPHPKGMLQEALPEWLEKCIGKIMLLGLFDDQHVPNHVLINEYLPGQGIMPHLDGPMYYPTVATISLGSAIIMDFYRPVEPTTSSSLESRYLTSLILEPYSLLVLKEDMYNTYLHGIAERTEDIVDCSKVCNMDQLSHSSPFPTNIKRTTRVSLTIRHVPKVLKVKLKLGKH
ncbi:alpha-ketoglutarate-dependent dioxygenase alkB homolog 6-like [Dysidea avara]|uniref:alpha-ketoglutarate-dependent dioxygenase alkB homolog 6-like n=1 Tax=Dysidea avara TaxID=196820 RepID=UPI003323E543